MSESFQLPDFEELPERVPLAEIPEVDEMANMEDTIQMFTKMIDINILDQIRINKEFAERLEKRSKERSRGRTEEPRPRPQNSRRKIHLCGKKNEMCENCNLIPLPVIKAYEEKIAKKVEKKEVEDEVVPFFLRP